MMMMTFCEGKGKVHSFFLTEIGYGTKIFAVIASVGPGIFLYLSLANFCKRGKNIVFKKGNLSMVQK